MKYLRLNKDILSLNDISLNEKLILSLLNQCEKAKNSTISKLLNIDIKAVERSIKKLKEYNYITNDRTINGTFNNKYIYIFIKLFSCKELNKSDVLLLSLLINVNKQKNKILVSNEYITKQIYFDKLKISRCLSNLEKNRFIYRDTKQLYFNGKEREIFIQSKAFSITYF